MATLPNSQQINLNLLHKYSTQFSFFESKITNQLIYNLPDSIYNIDYKEALIYSDQFQAMRRYYRYFTNYGRPEIKDRLKALTDFYQRALVMTYEYPNMIITNFGSIYQRRLRRMRKMIASDASSDCSEDIYYGKYNNTFSSLFLDEGSEVLSAIDKPHYLKVDLTEDYFDEQNHCIYEDMESLELVGESSLIEQLEQVQEDEPVMKLKFLNEDSFSHLMCDFDQIDEEKIEKQYNVLQERKQKRAEEQSKNEQKDSKKKGDIDLKGENQKMSFNTNQLGKLLRKNSPQALTSLQIPKNKRDPKQNIQMNDPNFWPVRLNIPTLPNPKHNIAIAPQQQFYKQMNDFRTNVKKELAVKREKKQKIRDKATALLQRVKSLDYYVVRSNLIKQLTKDQGSTTAMLNRMDGSDEIALKNR